MVSESDNLTSPGPVQRVIAFSARNPVLCILTVCAMALWGYYSLRAVPLDAIPDLSDAQVIVLTKWPGRSPNIIEDQITYPLSSTLLAAPRVRFVRGQSFLGLSFVYVIFEDGTDIYWARSRVLEYLNTATAKLPEGVTPTMGPDATGVGWVFQYALTDKSGKHDLAELRSLQDWHIRYSIQSVKGVAEVASVGGFVKQYQINLDPDKLLAHNIPIGRVIQMVRRSNNDVGGRTVEISGHEGMHDMGEMEMPWPKNSIPMVGAHGPFDYITMGGMFSIVKIRENLDSYDDPGWYQHPKETVASLARADELARDGISL